MAAPHMHGHGWELFSYWGQHGGTRKDQPFPRVVMVSHSSTFSTPATCLRVRESLGTLLMNTATNMVTTAKWKQVRRESSGEHLRVLRPFSYHCSTEDIRALGQQVTSPTVQRSILGRNQRPALTLGGLPLRI